MELDLKNIGQTLAIGGFTIFGLFHLISLCKASWKSKLTSLFTGDQKFPRATMLLALIFVVGMLVEDISKNFTAERWSVAKIFYIPFDTDKQLLLRSLFEVDSSSEQYILRPKPLYVDLMSVEHDNLYFTNHSKKIIDIQKAENPIDIQKAENSKAFLIGSFKVDRKSVDNEDGALRVAVSGMFYAAKNRVYMDGNYFSELREIVARINFARSIIFICLLYFVGYLLALLIWFLAWMKFRFLPDKLDFKFFHSLLAVNVRLVSLFLLAYLVGAVLAGIAFRSESRENNQRVLGYYTSIIANSKEIIKNDSGS